MNCTPKVRQKTFGVQFVYEKDLHRETQHSKPIPLWGTPETFVRTVSSRTVLFGKSARSLSQIRRRRTISQGTKIIFKHLFSPPVCFCRTFNYICI